MIEKGLEEEEELKEESKNLLADFKKKEKKMKDNVKKKLKEFRKKEKQFTKIAKKQEVAGAAITQPLKTRSKLIWYCLILIISSGLVAILVWLLTRGEVSTNVPTSVPTYSLITISPTKVPTKIPTKVPTKVLTKIPTKTPSLIPTSNPTINPTHTPTANPTNNPTNFINSLIIYNAGSTATGNMGNRSVTTATCAAQALVLALTCEATPMMLSYTTSQVNDFPTLYNFPLTSPIYSINNTLVSSSWNAAMNTAILASLQATGVFPPTTSVYSTGGKTATNTLSNCGDWASATSAPSPRTSRGAATATLYPAWFSGAFTRCNVLTARMCLCTSRNFI